MYFQFDSDLRSFTRFLFFEDSVKRLVGKKLYRHWYSKIGCIFKLLCIGPPK